MINGSEFLREIDDDVKAFFGHVEDVWHARRANVTGIAKQAGQHILDMLPHNLPETREALAHLAAFASAAVAAVDAAEQAAQEAPATATTGPAFMYDIGGNPMPADDPAELDPEAARVADALSPSGLIPAQ